MAHYSTYGFCLQNNIKDLGKKETMEIKLENRSHWIVLSIRGRLDSFNYEHLSHKLDLIQKVGKKKLALDLKGVSFLNIAAARLIASVGRGLRKNSGEVVIISPKPEHEKHIQLFSGKNPFKIYPDFAAFESSFKKQGDSP